MRCLVLVLFAVCGLTGGSRADDQNPSFEGKTLSEWTVMLRESPNARLRKVAVVAMSQIATDTPEQTKLVKGIMTALGKAVRNDSAPGVRAEAARSLGRAALQLIDDRAADVASVVIDLSESLRAEKEPEVRLETAVALGRFGPLAKTGVQPLAAALADQDPQVREAAATTLGRIGPDAKSATDDLLPLLKATELPVRKAAVFALGRVEPEDLIKPSQALAPLVQSEQTPEMRAEVLTTLGLLGDKSPETVRAVAAGLTDKDVAVRREAAKSLSRFFVGAKVAQKELLNSFKADEDMLVRAYALRSLGMAAGEDVDELIGHLIERLDPKVEPEAEVRIAICDELGAMGPSAQRAVPALRIAQKDPETRVRAAATAALKKTTAKAAPKTDK